MFFRCAKKFSLKIFIDKNRMEYIKEYEYNTLTFCSVENVNKSKSYKFYK